MFDGIKISYSHDGIDYEFDVPKVGIRNGRNYFSMETDLVYPNYRAASIYWSDNAWTLSFTGDGFYSSFYTLSADVEFPTSGAWVFTGGQAVDDLFTDYVSLQLLTVDASFVLTYYGVSSNYSVTLVQIGISSGFPKFQYVNELLTFSIFAEWNASFFYNGDLASYTSATLSSDFWEVYNEDSNFSVSNLVTQENIEPPTPIPPHTNILASGISQVEHLAAFDAMVEQRFANLNIEAVLIYLIDTVNASALPSLAAQFDVLGYKGYGLAQTEQQRRDVIKKAIELHRYKGTPWSIKEALKAIGYYDATVQERLVNPIYYDGTFNHNGSQFYGPGHWADFRVTIDLGNDMGVTAQTAADAVKLILEYKNVRSRLRDVSYQASLIEYVTDIQEEVTMDIEVVNSDALGYYYNGEYIYSGQITHGTGDETVTP